MGLVPARVGIDQEGAALWSPIRSITLGIDVKLARRCGLVETLPGHDEIPRRIHRDRWKLLDPARVSIDQEGAALWSPIRSITLGMDVQLARRCGLVVTLPGHDEIPRGIHRHRGKSLTVRHRRTDRDRAAQGRTRSLGRRLGTRQRGQSQGHRTGNG